MNLKIREATINDYVDINSLVIEVHNLHVKNRPDVFVAVDNPLLKSQYEDLLSREDTKIFVVENIDNTELVAYSIVQIMATPVLPIVVSSKFAHIDNFCIKASCKRNGIGKLLFQYIADYAKSEKLASLQLSVWEFNQDAIEFYEALGMKTRTRKMELNL